MRESKTPRASTLTLGLAAALMSLVAAPARAQDDDLLSSVYTDNGIEVRNDGRLFALFCALNAAGFDRADLLRELPFPKRTFHPVRQRLRVAFLTADTKLRGQIDDAVETFFDAHPQPVDEYVEAALHLGDGPEFAAKQGFPEKFAGLDKALAGFSAAVKLEKVQRSLVTDMRSELKRLRDVVDAPFMKLRGAWKLDEETAPGLVVVPNPLDAADVAYAFRDADDMHIVVVGMPKPGAPVNLKPALVAYNALLAKESTHPGEVPPALDEAVQQLKGAGLLPFSIVDGRALIAASARSAVAAMLWGNDPAAEADQAFRSGFILARDFAKAVEADAAGFPADKGPFALQVAARAEVKKLLTELLKPPDSGKPGRK